MNKLKEMQDSCAVFAADLKTGSVQWQPKINGNKQVFGFTTKVLQTTITVDFLGFYSEANWFHVFTNTILHESKLKSETAKEAAYEALQLVKQEAQKLVDELEVEPKEDNYSKDFLEWRGKYFYSKKEVKEWKSKQNNTSYSNKELEDRYKNAFFIFPI